MTYYIEKDGQWKNVLQPYVGKDGQWVPMKLRLIGKDGRWVLAYADEHGANIPSLLEVDSVSYRGGGPLQGELVLKGVGLGELRLPVPAVGVYYTFHDKLGDYLENLDACLVYGDTLPVIGFEDQRNALIFDETQRQYATAPVGSDGTYDLLGLMGSDGTGLKHWELGGKFKPKTWPPTEPKFVYWSGTDTQNVSVFYTDDGTLHARFKNGAYVKELTIPNAVQHNAWCGFVFRHRLLGGTQYLELQDGNNGFVSVAGDRLVGAAMGFDYWIPAANVPIKIGTGTSDGTITPAAKFFLASNTAPVYTISSDGYELTNATADFNSAAIPSGLMTPNTGRYYIEVLNRGSYNVQFGVTDNSNTGSPPGLIGWVIATINGRKFAKQTDDGTNWTAAIPANSTIGLVYDSDRGLIEIYVNGVKRSPDPFPVGTITTPVSFIIGGAAQVAGTNNFNPRVLVSRADWLLTPVGTLNTVPFSQSETPGVSKFSPIAVRDFYMRNAPMASPDVTKLLLDTTSSFQLMFRELNSGVTHQVNPYVLKRGQTELVMSVPQLDEGEYTIEAKYGDAVSTPRLFTIREQSFRTTPLTVDFRDDIDTRKALMRAHKQWGGANGGVSADNVTLDTTAGIATLTACGDLYTGPVLGVDREGRPSGLNKRIGACLVTRDYFGPASYRVLVKPLTQKGACNALWTFHYEEGYPGSPVTTSMQADGLHQNGNIVDGYFMVRNHEIDIEFPTALKTDPNQEEVAFHNARFNSWRGELRNWDVPNNDVPTSDPLYSPVNDPAYWSEYTDHFVDHGVNLGDGEFHELRFDWHLGPDARIEFYIDGVLKHTLTTHIPDIPGRFWVGVWFPSASSHWAGRGANWDTDQMLIKSLTITPFEDEQQYVRNLMETYPNDVYRDFKHINI